MKEHHLSAAPAVRSTPSTPHQSLATGALAERLGIKITEATAQRVVGTMPVAGNTQPAGLLHGGASAAFAETLASIGASLHAGPERHAVGLDLTATHHRPADSGRLTGIATPAHLGRTVATYDVTITDDQGRRIASCRLTCLLRP
ncbi:aromatic compound degradation protein PaaI [Streptacidiphilus pinicola]|uniref:Aromatic compound degradation protein PaaI n=1 Tax=Streptacidiphilus pinicola TaxID=2219663 RepID=A0A2X0I6J2_9ACTN|nr:aromatic compound degradation protein PaaI [Streptacidiphilus pinicola]